MVGALFDRTLRHQVYEAAKIDSGKQTYQKLSAVTGYIQVASGEIEDLLREKPDLRHLHTFREDFMRLLNRPPTRFLLSPLLPRGLITKSGLNTLFLTVKDYIDNTDADPIYTHLDACKACDEFVHQAENYGTVTSGKILGGLGRQLKAAIEDHFNTWEEKTIPQLAIVAIAKKYPLMRPNERINFKIRITNGGNGPARELMVDELVADSCLRIQTSQMQLGTLQPGRSLDLDIEALVVGPTRESGLVAQFSWLRPRGRSQSTHEFKFLAQREDIDWDEVELTEPYSLEAITTEDELIGRKDELKRLLRLTGLRTVGSGFIYGHKRVGKTSLANAVEERLRSQSETKWVVINKGSRDYVGPDASRTIRNLGDVLAEAMLENIPHLAAVPIPDFTNGLAPLSGYVDKALADKELRLLFILDEFDELPPELFERTDSSSSLFQPLRQISNKRGCGFLLVGGENMQRIVTLQGDRLNKFRTIEVGSFERSDDFAELIRKPVKNWLTISDSALYALFDWSAGNPYFAKLLATELFTLVVEHHYSDASEIEVTEAIDRTLNNIGANSFAHFWTDGLIDSADRLDEQHMIRRAVLIAVGRALRRIGPSDADSIWTESGPAIGFPIGENRFRMALQGFVRRGILAEDDEGYISPQIPLFQAWLKDDGVGELLEDSRQLDDLRAKMEDEERVRVKGAEVVDLCKTWHQFRYRGQSILPESVSKWLEQFETLEERRLMFRLLERIRLYDESTVRAKMREAFGIVARNIRTVIETGSRTRRDVLEGV